MGMASSRLVLAVGCGILLLRCASGAAVRPPSETPLLPVVSGPQFDGIIVPRLVNFAESWTPTEAQVASAEPYVQECVLSKRPGLKSTLRMYFRQYSGITVAGRRQLRIDFFDTRHYTVDQLRHPLVVCDGDPDDYPVVVYNLESATCSFLGN